jgi:hypothetical protein
MSNDELTENEMNRLLDMLFPGREDFLEGQIIPSLYGDPNPIVSLMLVLDEEAASYFANAEEVLAGVSAGVRHETDGLDIYLQVDIERPEAAELQFFTIVPGGEGARRFALCLTHVDNILLWLVDKEQNLLQTFQAPWDWTKQAPALTQLTESS